jgi:hydroxypyruvate reductase
MIGDPPALLRAAFDAAVAAADPAPVLRDWPLPKVSGRIALVAVGKGAARMAAAMRPRLRAGDQALVITGHDQDLGDATGLEVIRAGHPLPDAGSVAAADRALALAEALGEGDLLLLLVSGGASAMMWRPLGGTDLADCVATNRILLASGLPIAAMNCVRRHLCGVKGGRLAATAWPAVTWTLAASDVAGDAPGDIGSGPGVGDATTLAEAKRLMIDRSLPLPIIRALADPANESPFPEDPRLAKAQALVITSPATALAAAETRLAAAGCHVVSLGAEIAGEAAEVGAAHAARLLALAERARPVALLSGGETTVTLTRRDGRGGRNKAYLLAAMQAMAGIPRAWGFAADTDGIDGSEDDAGAWFGPDTMAAIIAAGGDIVALAAAERSYDAFALAGTLVHTGATGVNANDLRILLAVPDGKKIG